MESDVHSLVLKVQVYGRFWGMGTSEIYWMVRKFEKELQVVTKIQKGKKYFIRIYSKDMCRGLRWSDTFNGL